MILRELEVREGEKRRSVEKSKSPRVQESQRQGRGEFSSRKPRRSNRHGAHLEQETGDALAYHPRFSAEECGGV